MEKPKKENQWAQASGGQGGPPSLQKLKAAKQEAEQALESSVDDPCYPVSLEKELIKRMEGFDMPWVKCVPLKISVVWDIYENGGRRNENHARYTLEESYPGYLKIVRDMEKMDQINGFHIGGPSPGRLDRVKASLKKVSATFHVIAYTGGRLEGIVNTDDPSDLMVHKGADAPYALIAISNNVPPGNHSTVIKSSNITPGPRLVKYPVAGILETLEGSTVGVSYGGPLIEEIKEGIREEQLVSMEEIQRGLKEEKLVKQIPVHEFVDYTPLKSSFRRDGTVTVHISLAPMRERWQVLVNTINVIGYGDRDRNFGVQVHTERRVEIIIEDGEFISAEGETSFVSIKPYSVPAGLYRCREENVEVAGTGTDIEAENYDQVRHAKRFNPPKNPHDEALKQEYLKIKKQNTPYAFPKTYPVEGTKSGDKVNLFFPKNSGYVVAHRCEPGDKFNNEWRGDWRKKWKTSERWTLRDYDRFLFPETIEILLENDWYTEYDYTTKFYGPNEGWKKCQEGTSGSQWENTDQIRVKRIE